MLILIDNGHGPDTPGKRSPDGKFLEAAYTREISRRVVADLIDRGYNAQLLVPEDIGQKYRRIDLRDDKFNKLDRANSIFLGVAPQDI